MHRVGVQPELCFDDVITALEICLIPVVHFLVS